MTDPMTPTRPSDPAQETYNAALKRLDAFELAEAIEREMVRSAPPKVEGGSDARRQWLADVLAVQMAFHEVGFGIEFTRAFDDTNATPPCLCGTDAALARGQTSWVRTDIVCPKHDGDFPAAPSSKKGRGS